MKVKIVNLSELTNDGNFCLSVKKHFKDCSKCNTFLSRFKQDKYDIKKTKAKLKCNPQIKDSHIKLMRVKIKVNEQASKINKVFEKYGITL